MPGLSAAGAKILWSEALRSVNPAQVPSKYVGLHTADTGANGANEQNGGGYARIQVGHAGKVWTFPNASTAMVYTVSNSARVEFATPTADYAAPITHWSLWDSSSSGTFIGGWALTQSITPQNAIPLYFGVGLLKLTTATVN